MSRLKFAGSFSEDTLRLIDIINKSSASISTKETVRMARDWIRNHYDLLEVLDKTSKGYAAFISLSNSVSNVRLVRLVWLRNLRLIHKEYNEQELQSGNGRMATPKDSQEKNFDDRKFHKSIVSSSRKLFVNKHYSQAIFEACKLLNKRVQELSGLSIDGKQLMLTTFTPNSPKLKLNSLLNQSDKDEQEGFMHIFAGVMHGIRNPKGHEVMNLRDQVKALEYLSLISILFRKLDESTI